MSRYAIVVDFRLKPGARQAFRSFIDANARLSAETEDGCRRFDILEPSQEADRVLLYEIYEDEAAFRQHVHSAHFADFEMQCSHLVASKSVTECELVVEAGAAKADRS